MHATVKAQAKLDEALRGYRGTPGTREVGYCHAHDVGETGSSKIDPAAEALLSM